MTWTTCVIALGLAAVIGACEPSAGRERTGVVNAEDSLLAVIRDLMGRHPFRPDAVSKVLGHRLDEVPARSTEYFQVYESSAPTAGGVAKVELRVPRAAGSTRGGLLILTVNPQPCLTRAAVIARFGSNPELAVPTPREPADSPVYLKYPMAWGVVSFGFQRSGDGCLRDVVLDGTGG